MVPVIRANGFLIRWRGFCGQEPGRMNRNCSDMLEGSWARPSTALRKRWPPTLLFGAGSVDVAVVTRPQSVPGRIRRLPMARGGSKTELNTRLPEFVIIICATNSWKRCGFVCFIERKSARWLLKLRQGTEGTP